VHKGAGILVAFHTRNFETASREDLERHAEMPQGIIEVGIDVGPSGIAHGSVVM
jgi:hypothetical protein